MNDLIEAIKNLHGCNATYSETAKVKEVFEGQTVWEGEVHIYNVDHPEADTCYAWSHPIEGSTKHKYYAVLKIPPVDSPEKAVRAAIVSDYKSE